MPSDAAMTIAEKWFPLLKPPAGMHRDGLAADIDSALLDARREQALVDCKVVCVKCATAKPLVHVGKTELEDSYYYHPSKKPDVLGRTPSHGVCDASEIYIAWHAATGEELR